MAAEGDCEAACGGSDVDEGGTGVILSTGEGGEDRGVGCCFVFCSRTMEQVYVNICMRGDKTGRWRGDGKGQGLFSTR